MMSEKSCDTGVMMFKIQLCITEIHYIFKVVFTTETIILNCNTGNTAQYYGFVFLFFFFCIFDQINEGLMSKRYLGLGDNSITIIIAI